jgi:hypothetical protein
LQTPCPEPAQLLALFIEMSAAVLRAALFIADRARLTKAHIGRQESAVSKKRTSRAVAPDTRRSEREDDATGVGFLPLQAPGLKAEMLQVDAMIVKQCAFDSAAVKNAAIQAAECKGTSASGGLEEGRAIL